LLDATREIYEQFKGDEVSTEHIAPILGQKPKSGSFLQKMADLRSYGLITGSRDKIKVTELGKQVTLFKDEAEKNAALQEIVSNIPLWRIFLDKYGYDIDEKNFWVELVRITGAERFDAQKEAKSVRRAYLKDVRYIKPVDEPTKPSQNGEALDREAADGTWSMEALPTESKIAIVNIESQGYRTRIEIKDWKSYKMLQNTLKSILEMLDINEEQTPPDSEITPPETGDTEKTDSK
jgi:hypothetical protein